MGQKTKRGQNGRQRKKRQRRTRRSEKKQANAKGETKTKKRKKIGTMNILDFGLALGINYLGGHGKKSVHKNASPRWFRQGPGARLYRGHASSKFCARRLGVPGHTNDFAHWFRGFAAEFWPLEQIRPHEGATAFKRILFARPKRGNRICMASTPNSAVKIFFWKAEWKKKPLSRLWVMRRHRMRTLSATWFPLPRFCFLDIFSRSISVTTRTSV